MISGDKPMISLGLLLMACTAGFAAANPDPPAPPFADEPEDALVRCLELPTGGAGRTGGRHRWAHAHRSPSAVAARAQGDLPGDSADESGRHAADDRASAAARLDVSAPGSVGCRLPAVDLPRRHLVRLDVLDRPRLDAGRQGLAPPRRETRRPCAASPARPTDASLSRAVCTRPTSLPATACGWPSATATRPSGRPRSTAKTRTGVEPSWNWTSRRRRDPLRRPQARPDLLRHDALGPGGRLCRRAAVPGIGVVRRQEQGAGRLVLRDGGRCPGRARAAAAVHAGTAGVAREDALVPGRPVALDGGKVLPLVDPGRRSGPERRGVGLEHGRDVASVRGPRAGRGCVCRSGRATRNRAVSLPPRQTVQLPPVIAAPYRGSWLGRRPCAGPRDPRGGVRRRAGRLQAGGRRGAAAAPAGPPVASPIWTCTCCSRPIGGGKTSWRAGRTPSTRADRPASGTDRQTARRPAERATGAISWPPRPPNSSGSARKPRPTRTCPRTGVSSCTSASAA